MNMNHCYGFRCRIVFVNVNGRRRLSFRDDFIVIFHSLHVSCSSPVDSFVAADAGIKAKPGSVCAGKSGDSFVEPAATVDITEVLDSSHCHSVGRRRKQTVSTQQYIPCCFCSCLHWASAAVEWFHSLLF